MTSTSNQPASGFEIFADNEVTAGVLAVIKGAKRQVALVSPYVDRVGHVEQELIKAKQNGVEILVVVRMDGNTVGGNNSGDALAWFKSQGIPVLTVPSVHAKFYINESEAVVTSMNLLKSSWSGSLELGMRVTGAHHGRLAAYLGEHLKALAQDRSVVTPAPRTGTRSKSTPRSARPRATKKKTEQPKGTLSTLGGIFKDLLIGADGYCIRCGEALEKDAVD